MAISITTYGTLPGRIEAQATASTRHDPDRCVKQALRVHQASLAKRHPQPGPVRVMTGLKVRYGFALGAPTNPYLLLLTGQLAVRQRLRAILRDAVLRYHDCGCG